MCPTQQSRSTDPSETIQNNSKCKRKEALRGSPIPKRTKHHKTELQVRLHLQNTKARHAWNVHRRARASMDYQIAPPQCCQMRHSTYAQARHRLHRQCVLVSTRLTKTNR
ncbi:hypothetical protein ACHAWX_006622 [Stephanocyclus meneghinianus]